MSEVLSRLGLMTLLHRVSLAADNPKLTLNAGSRVECDWQPEHLSVDALKGQTPAISTGVEN
jgi:ferric-dicitrate binding protein FerR (iron transport regulator)